MTYEKHNYNDGYQIVSDGTVIYEQTGASQWPNEDALNAVLLDVGFTQNQKDAIMAVLGNLPVENFDQKINA